MSDFQAPNIDWAALTPELVLLGGASFVLVLTLFLSPQYRRPFAAVVAGLCFVGAGIAAGILFSMDESGRGIVADALRRDRLAELAQILIAGSGFLAVLVSYEEPEGEDRLGEWYALLLSAAAGMAFFVAAPSVSAVMSLFLKPPNSTSAALTSCTSLTQPRRSAPAI